MLHHRINATHLWTPDARELYYAAPLREGSAGQKGRHTRARMAAKQLHDSLFPED
jgi:hypothetical protein